MDKYNKNLKKIAKTNKYDCWDLDIELATFIIPRLKLIKKEKFGVPASFFDEFFGDSKDETKLAQKEFHKVIDKVILCFTLIKNGGVKSKKEDKIIKKGLKLFIKHLSGLWT